MSQSEHEIEQSDQIVHVGLRKKNVDINQKLVDFEDPQIKQDMIRMIMQYLDEEGYVLSRTVLEDEANVKANERKHQKSFVQRMRKSILDGEWSEVEKLCTNPTFKHHKHFLFSVFKQQFVEQLDHKEYQKAFSLLTRKIKPLEKWAAPGEFKELCYSLTCNSLQDSSLFKGWEGITASREKLVEHFKSILKVEVATQERSDLPSSRLQTLIQQSCAYQIEFCRYQPQMNRRIETLIENFQPFIIPNAQRHILHGHTENVKCVDFVGEEGNLLASGSSDNTVRLWDTEDGSCARILKGHTSRVWSLSSDVSGSFVVSASADRTVKLWNLETADDDAAVTFDGHTGDVYSCTVHPDQQHIVSGGYDKSVNLFDINTQQCVETFNGHELAVSSTACNRYGNLIITGSKDSSVKFWDICSGVCVKTLAAHFGEVTCVCVNERGDKLLVSSKDNSNRLWDLRMLRPIQRLRGHYNTSRNFIRASFGPSRHLVTGGSEDGQIPIWDIDSGKVVKRLRGHTGTVYNACWSERQSLLASCGDDGIVNIWWYDDQLNFGQTQRLGEEEEAKEKA